MNRRGFIGSILALSAAPAIVRPESLMRIAVIQPEVLVRGEVGCFVDTTITGRGVWEADFAPKFSSDVQVLVDLLRCGQAWAVARRVAEAAQPIVWDRIDPRLVFADRDLLLDLTRG